MTVSPHAILSKQTNFWWKSKSNFEAQYFLLATEFSVSIDIKSDHDKPNYNPYLHKNFCSKDESFHNEAEVDSPGFSTAVAHLKSNVDF